MALCTCAGESPGWPARYNAAAPATCGAAIDVPLIVLVAVSPVPQADVMLMPGANTSTQVPRLAHDGLASLLLVAETVIAVGTRAGDWVQASSANSPNRPLPAAIE